MENGRPVRILLVEDDPAHAEIVRRNLADSRVANKITYLVDGQEALDYLFRQAAYADPKSSPRPDIILLDLRLPKVDGVGGRHGGTEATQRRQRTEAYPNGRANHLLR